MTAPFEEDDDEVLPTLEDDEDFIGYESEQLFATDLLQWAPDRKDGSIVAMTLGNSSILVATSKHFLFMLSNTGNTLKFEIPKKYITHEKNRIHKIFMDWNSNHILVTYPNDSNIYFNVHKAKPLQLNKCKGLVIESVVWDEHDLTKTNTGVILFGTTEGGIYEMTINEMKEKNFSKLYDLNTCRASNATESTRSFHEVKTSSRVCGLHVEYLLPSKEEVTEQHSSQNSMTARPVASGGLGAGRSSELVQHQSALLSSIGFMDDDSDEEELAPRKPKQSQQITSSTSTNTNAGTTTSSGNTPAGTGASSTDRKQSLSSSSVKESGRQRFYVVAVIPNRIYEFIGGPTLGALFRAYDDKPEFKEVPGSIDHTALSLYRPNNITESIGWLMEQGIALAKVSFLNPLKQGDKVVGDKLMENFIKFGGDDHSKDDYWHGMERATPIGFTITPFHILLVYPNCILAVNILSKKCVQYTEIPKASGDVIDVRAMSPTLAFVACEHQLYQIQSENETRDVWKLFLDQKDFDKANKHCRNNFQRQKVLRAEADHYFNLPNYTEAAKKYAHLSYLSNVIQSKKPANDASAKIEHKTDESSAPGLLHRPRDKLDVTFEDIALKFITVDETDALMVFLQETLSRTRTEDKTQRTMLATWLTEMHLAKISRKEEMELEQNEQSTGASSTNNMRTEKNLAVEAFEKFLRQEKKTLSQCKEVIFDLIASHGRTQQLLVFGEIQNDWTWVIRYYIQNGEMKEAIKELSRLSDPSQHEQLYYDFAPVLMHAYPKETIDMILKVRVLDPKKLVPALMRFESNEEFYQSMQDHLFNDINDELLQHSNQQHNVMRPINADNNKGMDFDFDEKAIAELQQQRFEKRNSTAISESRNMSIDVAHTIGRDRGITQSIPSISQEHTRQAIRYLEEVIRSNLPQSKDAAIHNYLITLYCKQKDEGPLLRFIDSQGDEPHYDTKYALRLCHQENRILSCVKLYEKMGLYEEAVNLALNISDNSFALAKSVVENFKRKEPLMNDENKRLWLIIARHVVKDSQEDMDKALKIINDSKCLSIEDILPHLSDFTNIGPFKPEIKTSLEKYSTNIKKLQDRMKTYTDTAEQIRQDTELLKQRSIIVLSNKKCSLSQQPALGSRFLLFPCQHMFRLDAVARKIMSHYDMDESKTNMNEILETAPKECPLCGKMMLEEVSRPFVNFDNPRDLEIARSWEIKDEAKMPS